MLHHPETKVTQAQFWVMGWAWAGAKGLGISVGTGLSVGGRVSVFSLLNC